MRIVIIGTGYVGLVTGVCLAKHGHKVTCIDHNVKKIELLKKGEIPFFEPDLEALFWLCVRNGLLDFSVEGTEALGEAEAAVIAVGTPTLEETGEADLSSVYKALDLCAQHMKAKTKVIIKSTVPVGTAAALEAYIAERYPTRTFGFISNPEFLKEGSALQDCLNPDRVVVGVKSKRSEQFMRELYKEFIAEEVPFLVTSNASAELIKYASNALLATKIAFTNEISDLCERTGASIQDVTQGMGLDQRIGPYFLKPGPGYGGSCFPKDTQALVSSALAHDVILRITQATIDSNDSRKASLARRVKEACGGEIMGESIAVLGLSFKANTDDVRESPALSLIPALQKMGATVRVYDPQAMENGKQYLSGVTWCTSGQEALEESFAAVIMTEWDEFKDLNYDWCSVVIDFRGLLTGSVGHFLPLHKVGNAA